MEALAWFRETLKEATAAIDRGYFLLPVASAGGEEPIEHYRERFPYSLGGEVDKRGHTLIRGGPLDNAKPDLLDHIPGGMSNLTVVEIESLKPQPFHDEREAFVWDLQKLIAFRGVGYEAAFMLVFGEPVDRVVDYGAELRRAGLSLDAVEL